MSQSLVRGSLFSGLRIEQVSVPKSDVEPEKKTTVDYTFSLYLMAVTEMENMPIKR